MTTHQTTVDPEPHLILSVSDHVWLVEDKRILECVVKKVYDEIEPTDPLYELTNPVLPGGFAFKRLAQIYTSKKMALITAITETQEAMDDLADKIALDKNEYNWRAKSLKQMQKELESLHDG